MYDYVYTYIYILIIAEIVPHNSSIYVEILYVYNIYIVYICLDVCIYTYIRTMCIYIYIYSFIYIYIYIYIYTYTLYVYNCIYIRICLRQGAFCFLHIGLCAVCVCMPGLSYVQLFGLLSQIPFKNPINNVKNMEIKWGYHGNEP